MWRPMRMPRVDPVPLAWLAAAALLALLVAIGATDRFDAWSGQRLASSATAWRAVTIAGDVAVLGTAAAVATAWLWRDRGLDPAARMAIVTGVAWLGTNLLKLAFGRPRPEDGLVDVASHAFPSGHALGAMAVYVAWARLAMPDGHGMQRAAIALGLLVGWSRVALGVHHVTDVLAGWCLAAALVTAVCRRPRRADQRTIDR